MLSRPTALAAALSADDPTGAAAGPWPMPLLLSRQGSGRMDAMERGDGAVFVYGTLMPGELRWPALEPFAHGWEDATAPGRLWDTGDGYPAATFERCEASIPGVVVWINADRWDQALRRLDTIEGEGSLYRRVEVKTSVGPATSYEWLGITAGLRPLPSGWPRRRSGP